MSNTSDPAIDRRSLLAGGVLAAGAAAVMAGPAAAQEGASPALPLSGKVALVTGAGRGIGRGVAEALARAGADVALLDIARDIPGHAVPLARPEDLAETRRLVEVAGRRAITIEADIRDLAAMRAGVERTVAELGRLDIVVANAGINAPAGVVAAVDEKAETAWRNTLDVNVFGTVNTLRATMPHLTGQKSGRVIVTTSTFGRQGNGGNPNYVASKWALTGLVKSAALEAGAHSVTVNAIAPTGVKTGLGGPRTAEQMAQADEFFSTSYHALPVGALEPEDMGGAVVFLASDAARYVTGVTIDVAAGANARYTG